MIARRAETRHKPNLAQNIARLKGAYAEIGVSNSVTAAISQHA